MQTMRLFCDIARLQSFSQAAEVNGITQSAASQRIGALERSLGVKLLDRSVRPLGLTPAGEVYFTEVKYLLERYEKLEHRICALRNGPAGQVRVDAIYSAGLDLLHYIEKAFTELHPKVNVTIRYRRPEEAHDAVRGGQCDLGIVSYPQRWRDVSYIPLRDEVMAVVCSRRHPLASRSQVRAAELGEYPMVNFEPSLPVGRAVKRYLKEAHADVEIVNVFDNIDTIKSAVAGTDCIAILPKRTVHRDVAAGSLSVVELTPQLVRPMGIVYRKRNASSPRFSAAVEAFVDFLLEHAGPDADVVDEIDARGRQMVGGKL